MSTISIVLAILAALLIYSAVKGKNPVQLIKSIVTTGSV